MSLSQEQIDGIRAILPEASFETDNEGQVVIYTGQYATDERPRYFPTASIPIPSDEYVATHPEEYSYEEAGVAWARLDQETRDRLEREFEERHPEMSDPYIPGQEDDRWPARPQHVR